MKGPMGNREAMERKLIADELRQTWDVLLSTPSGRLLVFDILTRCGVLGYSLPSDLSAYLEGRRSIGVDLMQEFLHPAEVFGRMLVENEERAERLAHAQSVDKGEDDSHEYE